MVTGVLNKKGFSIAEALISMLILSVFFVATSKVATQKQQPEVQEYSHGFYECYWSNETLMQNQGVESTAGTPQAVESCTFTPPTGIALAIMYAAPGVQNGVNRVYKSVEPQFNKPITPITSKSQLASFYADEMYEPESSDLTINDLKTCLKLSYPKSGLYALLNSGAYTEPALFIGW